CMRSPLVLLISQTTPPPEIFTLSLHDALPISAGRGAPPPRREHFEMFYNDAANAKAKTLSDKDDPTLRCQSTSFGTLNVSLLNTDRKSTRLNSSHVAISYAVFCLKKKTKTTQQ